MIKHVLNSPVFFIGQLMKKRDLHVTFNLYTAEKEKENSAKPLLY